MTKSLAVAFGRVGERVEFMPDPRIVELNAHRFNILPPYRGEIIGFENHNGTLWPVVLLDNTEMKVFGPA